MSRPRAFAQRLTPAIYKYESSLASAGEGKLSGQSVYRDAADLFRALPAVKKPADAHGLPKPLIEESRTLFGKHVTYNNPWAPGAAAKSVWDVMKLLRTSKNFGKSPSEQECSRDLPLAEVESEAIAKHNGDAPMRVTWIGHSTLLIQMDGLNILTDPVFSQRASANQMIGPKRYSPPAMQISQLPRIDLVLISHNHFDHLDSGSVSAIGDGPLWLVPMGVKPLMAKLGVNRCVELSWWEEVEVEGSRGAVRVSSTPAQHWSQRGPFDRKASLWCGYAIVGERERFFFAGDTAYAPIFPQIGERYGPFDLAAIPIAAYKPIWFMKDNHCSPDEAVVIHQELGAKRSLAVHWGTFPLAEDLHADAPRELVESSRARGLKNSEFCVIRHGESLVNDGSARRYKCVFGSDDL